MAIAPINYATIQRTADIETFKNQQDTKPMVDQQNIQVQGGCSASSGHPSGRK